MSDVVQASLDRALDLTVEMIEAAVGEQWERVLELDHQRQVHLRQVQAAGADARHRDALRTLQAHNQTLLERARLVHDAMEHKISQHHYNHRALRAYVASTV